jgi:protein SCO1/2
VRLVVFALALTLTGCSVEDAPVERRPEPASAASPARLGAGERADPGRIVPAFPLIDQDGRAFTMHDFGGRVLVTTFVFTRCPMPDFCPLMVKHLEAVRGRAGTAGFGDRLALLGITLDPAFDTPDVLRAYGRAVLKAPDRFERWTLATATPEQIADVTAFFGVSSRNDAGMVTHSLMTAVIGHDGRIMRLFPANSWQPDELLEVVRLAVQRASAGVTR